MSEAKLYVCAGCGAETRDYYAEKGWLVLRGKLLETRGRRKDGQARTHFLATSDAWTDEHFCGSKCLMERLRKAKP